MSKLKIIEEIKSHLDQLKMPYELDTESDLVISQELFKIGFFGGKRSIYYDASLRIDEDKSVLYFFEKVKDSRSGINFGVESSSYTQSGVTQYRKLKLIQVALDGKTYEYSVNLGDIVRGIKSISKENGYKFKMVINQSKVLNK